jgi:transposase-like protein
MARSPTKLHPQVRDEIIQLAHSGATIAMIANELPISYESVRRVLAEEGITTARETALARETGNDDGIRIRAVPVARAKEIARDYTAGMPIPDLLEKHGISAPTMYKILRVFEIPNRTELAAQARVSAFNDAIGMYYNGAKLWEITRATGISSASLIAELHKRGFELRGRKQHRPQYTLAHTIDQIKLDLDDEQIQLRLDAIIRDELQNNAHAEAVIHGDDA